MPARSTTTAGPGKGLLGLVTALALLAVGCSGGEEEPAPSTTEAAPSTTVPTIVVQNDTSAAESYFAALASRDPEQAADMLAASAPGSMAEGYAVHQSAVRGVLGPAESGALDRGLDRFVVCSGPAELERPPTCTEFGGLAFDDKGRLESFTVAGSDLGDRIATGGPAVLAERISVRVLSAYRSPTTESTLVVLEIVNSSDHTFEILPFAATYRPTEDSPAVEADASWGLTEVAAGDKTSVLVRFSDVSLNGVLHVGGWGANSIGTTFAVRLTG